MAAPDMTGQYNTKLSASDEAGYQAWAAANGRLSDTRDYDMRGWWQEHKNDPVPAGGQHFTDKYKKPSHPTFSTESQYSGKDGNVGGVWKQDGENWQFTPGKTNLKNMTPDEMREYFRRTEGPDTTLNLPSTSAEKLYPDMAR